VKEALDRSSAVWEFGAGAVDAGGTELFRLEMAHALAGAAGMQRAPPSLVRPTR
jgi:hypothetical protein